MANSVVVLGKNSRVFLALRASAPLLMQDWTLLGHAELQNMPRLPCRTFVVLSYARADQYPALVEAIRAKVQYQRLVFISSLSAVVLDRVRRYPYPYPRNKARAESLFRALPRAIALRLPTITNSGAEARVTSIAPGALAALLDWIDTDSPSVPAIAARLDASLQRRGGGVSWESSLILRTGGVAAYGLVLADAVRKVVHVKPYGYSKLSNELLAAGGVSLVVG